MSHKGKVVSFGVRRPGAAVAAIPEDAIRELEQKAEGLGNGIAGKTAPKKSKPKSRKAPEIPVGAKGIVERKGRLRADGSRTDARTLRRMTVYLSPDTVKALEMQALESGRNKSELIQAALAEHLDV